MCICFISKRIQVVCPKNLLRTDPRYYGLLPDPLPPPIDWNRESLNPADGGLARVSAVTWEDLRDPSPLTSFKINSHAQNPAC